MKFFLVSVVLAGMLVGCGSDDNEETKSSPDPTATPSHVAQDDTNHPTATPTPTPTDNTQTGGNASGTSKYLKFDEEFISERESAGDRYYMVGCEDNGYDLNGRDIDIARYDIKTSNYVDKYESGDMAVTIKNGKLFFGESYNFKIIGDYGNYVVVQAGFGDFRESLGHYTYWFPKPLVNSDVENIFQEKGDNYMHDFGDKEFIHEGHCSPNSLNEHIADWKSLQ